MIARSRYHKEKRGLVGNRPSSLLKAIALLTLLAVAAPASADYFTFEGELKFEASPNAMCAAMSAGTFQVRISGRSDGRGIEASLDGDKLVHASIRGANP